MSNPSPSSGITLSPDYPRPPGSSPLANDAPEESAAAPPQKSKEEKRQIKRTRVANEVLETEKSYVNSLEQLVERYLKPLREGDILSHKMIDFIFSNIEHILIINRELLDALEQRLSEWSVNPCLGDVMNKLIPWLRLYSDYCSNYHNAISTVNDKMKGKNAFSGLLERQREKYSMLDMPSLLIMPIQRLPRYRLLLEEMVDLTPEDHPDFSALSNALDKVRDVADVVNDSVRARQDLEKLEELERMFMGKVPKNFVSKHRVFVHEGELTKMCKKAPKKRTFFLFNDMLIYGEEFITKGAITGRSYRIHRAINLRNGGRMIPVEDGEGVTNRFMVVSKAKSFFVWTNTAEEKAIWEEKLLSAQSMLEKTTTVRLSDGDFEMGSVGADAPVWQSDKDSKECMLCGVKWTKLRRRHHCRRCGILVCGKCSENKFELPHLGKSRVCDDCYESLAGKTTYRRSMRLQQQGASDTSKKPSSASSLIDKYAQRYADPEAPPPGRPADPPSAAAARQQQQQQHKEVLLDDDGVQGVASQEPIGAAAFSLTLPRGAKARAAMDISPRGGEDGDGVENAAAIPRGGSPGSLRSPRRAGGKSASIRRGGVGTRSAVRPRRNVTGKKPLPPVPTGDLPPLPSPSSSLDRRADEEVPSRPLPAPGSTPPVVHQPRQTRGGQNRGKRGSRRGRGGGPRGSGKRGSSARQRRVRGGFGDAFRGGGGGGGGGGTNPSSCGGSASRQTARPDSAEMPPTRPAPGPSMENVVSMDVSDIMKDILSEAPPCKRPPPRPPLS